MSGNGQHQVYDGQGDGVQRLLVTPEEGLRAEAAGPGGPPVNRRRPRRGTIQPASRGGPRIPATRRRPVGAPSRGSPVRPTFRLRYPRVGRGSRGKNVGGPLPSIPPAEAARGIARIGVPAWRDSSRSHMVSKPPIRSPCRRTVSHLAGDTGCAPYRPCSDPGWSRPSGYDGRPRHTAPSSSGLGHHPLKVETRVRIPLGLLGFSLTHLTPCHIRATSFQQVAGRATAQGGGASVVGTETR